MSVPFFYEPHCDFNVNSKLPGMLCNELAEGFRDPKEFYPFAAFLLNKMPIYIEYAGTFEFGLIQYITLLLHTTFQDICKNLPDWVREKYLDGYSGNMDCWATKSGIEVDGANYEQRKVAEEAASKA